MDVGVERKFSPQKRCCAISSQDFQPMWSWSTNV